MPAAHKPRSGSLQYWPRVRSKRIYSSIKSWLKNNNNELVGFAGYKAGMTHLIEKKDWYTPQTKNQSVFTSVTIIECPPLKPFSLRFYNKTPYGSEVISQIYSKNLDKELSRKVTLPKKQQEKEIPKEYDHLRLVVYTQPKLTSIGKKKPEIFEIPVDGNLEFAKSLLEKEIKVSDIFKAGQFVDVHAITKGKGFQGPVKRFGISLKSHKSEKKRRAPGNLGAFTPRKTDWRVPQHGQHGYHKRTDYNKQIYKIDDNPETINQKGGIKGYGNLKNEYLLIKGSVHGSSKRLIILSKPIRNKKDAPAPTIEYVSQTSKQ
jgi:large subunit ribosomal protein L3